MFQFRLFGYVVQCSISHGWRTGRWLSGEVFVCTRTSFSASVTAGIPHRHASSMVHLQWRKG